MTALEEKFSFPDMRFSRVLSLGADDVGHGPGAAPPDGAATVFDRLASSLDAVVAMLADDGTRLGLRFVAADAGAAVRCAAYGVRCLDAFRRNDEGGIDFSTGEIERCRADLAASMAAFLRACEDASDAVLFLRRETRTGSAVDGLTAALATRFPALEFRLLVEVPVVGPDRPHDRRAALVPLPAGGDAWHPLLARQQLTGPDEAGCSVDGGQPPELPDDALQAVAGAADAAHSSGATPTEGEPEAVLSSLPSRLADGSAAPDLAWRIGTELWRSGRASRAAEAFALAYAHGCRDLGFLRDHIGLLTGETRYREVIDVAAALRRDGFADHPSAACRLAMLVGHAQLALAHPREAEIARAAARAASPVWLDPPTLLRTIAAAIAERRPFAFTRLGDGEARYLLGEATVETSGLTDEEAHAMGDLVWENWFGAPLSAVDTDRRANLHAAFVDAVRAADVVGVCSHERLRADTGHYGYLAWQEAWLRDLTGGVAGRLFTDAQVHYRLNAEAPFLATLLEGQDVLGVISPHPGLADALGRRLSIGRMINHLIPAEGRLPSAARMRETLGPHFPQVYDHLMASLTVPRPGCVFLVAAGLLGKIYCARIKALGGIALDIGALADAWMGFDTRDGQLAQTPQLPTLPPAVQAGERTIACLSMHKTGSTALAAALRGAVSGGVIHSHQAGPRSIALQRRFAPKPTTLDDGSSLVARFADRDGALALVTCVRDPIAQAISMYFQFATSMLSTWGFVPSLKHDDFVVWWEQNIPPDYPTWWFEDNLKATFGIDIRKHPFDHSTKSLRCASERLRLVCVRFEDSAAAKEAALGWLVERDHVALPHLNATTQKSIGEAYRKFAASFTAPPRWIDTFYETDLIRHFYTVEERAAFRMLWSGGRTRARQGSSDQAAFAETPASDRQAISRGAKSEPESIDTTPSESRTTYGCLSFGKTGSMALADAVHNAGIPNAVHLHFLGPRAIAIKRADPEPMLDLAIQVAERIADPDHAFRFVTAVRDPIARILSQAFYTAERHHTANGGDIRRDPEALIAWWEAKHMARRDVWSEWFDDTYRTTFGFDFRAHPFDHTRKSLRYESGRLRLLVLRQEDDRAGRAAELGWLLDREGVVLRTVNDAANQDYEAAYRPFLETFVAPSAWLETYYETEVIRHFYSAEERAAFKARWSGRGRSRRGTVSLVQASPAGDVGPNGGSRPPDASDATRTDSEAYVQHPVDSQGRNETALELDRARTELETLRLRLREGHAVDFNDYAYRPRERDWRSNAGASRLRALFAASESAYAELLERFCTFDDRFRTIPVLPSADGPHWENWWLPGLDAVALYGLVATQAPRTYLEIGSGHSTRFVRRAIQDHGLSTRIVSIDPNPTADIEALCDEVVRVRCEDAPSSVFAALEAGDMLFFDGSHRSFQNSDATVFFTEILPGLAPGVVYGLHDIFLPYDYPESWTNRFYNEQYLLMAYLLGGAGGDEVVFPAHHVWREPAYAAMRNRLFLGSRHIDWLTSSFWMRRAGVPPEEA